MILKARACSGSVGYYLGADVLFVASWTGTIARLYPASVLATIGEGGTGDTRARPQLGRDIAACGFIYTN